MRARCTRASRARRTIGCSTRRIRRGGTSSVRNTCAGRSEPRQPSASASTVNTPASANTVRRPGEPSNDAGRSIARSREPESDDRAHRATSHFTGSMSSTRLRRYPDTALHASRSPATQRQPPRTDWRVRSRCAPLRTGSGRSPWRSASCFASLSIPGTTPDVACTRPRFRRRIPRLRPLPVAGGGRGTSVPNRAVLSVRLPTCSSVRR